MTSPWQARVQSTGSGGPRSDHAFWARRKTTDEIQ